MDRLRKPLVLPAALVLLAVILQAPVTTVAQIPIGVARDGDVVFRRGASLISRMVLAAGDGALYSHAGIIEMRRGVPWVIHSSTDEAAPPHTGVMAEPLAGFLAPGKATAAALYRPAPEYQSLAHEAAMRASSFALRHLPFDVDFDLDTPEALYCTELVWRAYRDAGVDLAAGRLRRLQLPFRSGYFLLPTDLARSPVLRLVFAADSSGDTP